MQRGLFRYDVTACETKVLFGLFFYSLALIVYMQITKIFLWSIKLLVPSKFFVFIVV